MLYVKKRKFVSNPFTMVKILIIVGSVICFIWVILSPSFESITSFIGSLIALIGVVYTDKKKLNKNYIYEVQIRGYKNIDPVVRKFSKEYFQITNYKKELIGGEWWNVVMESKSTINHEDLFYSIRKIVKGTGKVYYVSGEGKSFGLIDDGSSPAQYF